MLLVVLFLIPTIKTFSSAIPRSCHGLPFVQQDPGICSCGKIFVADTQMCNKPLTCTLSFVLSQTAVCAAIVLHLLHAWRVLSALPLRTCLASLKEPFVSPPTFSTNARRTGRRLQGFDFLAFRWFPPPTFTLETSSLVTVQSLKLLQLSARTGVAVAGG